MSLSKSKSAPKNSWLCSEVDFIQCRPYGWFSSGLSCVDGFKSHRLHQLLKRSTAGIWSWSSPHWDKMISNLMPSTNSFPTAYGARRRQDERTVVGNGRRRRIWCEPRLLVTSPDGCDSKLEGSDFIRSSKRALTLELTGGQSLGVVSERKCNATRGWRAGSWDR